MTDEFLNGMKMVTYEYEAEFSHGELVQITLKEGKPFNPNQIIDLSEDPEKVSLLFEE